MNEFSIANKNWETTLFRCWLWMPCMFRCWLWMPWTMSQPLCRVQELPMSALDDVSLSLLCLFSSVTANLCFATLLLGSYKSQMKVKCFEPIVTQETSHKYGLKKELNQTRVKWDENKNMPFLKQQAWNPAHLLLASDVFRLRPKPFGMSLSVLDCLPFCCWKEAAAWRSHCGPQLPAQRPQRAPEAAHPPAHFHVTVQRPNAENYFTEIVFDLHQQIGLNSHLVQCGWETQVFCTILNSKTQLEGISTLAGRLEYMTLK